MNHRPRVWCSKYYFFYTFYRLRALKTLYFFCNFFLKNKKINWKDFCKEFCKKSWKKWYLEHQTLGRQFVCPIVQTTLRIILKSVNLQYNTLGRLDDGTNESSTKRLMFQVLFFFMISCKILCKNPFNLFSYFFYKITKIKIKSFECPKSIKSIKKIILGTSDSWLTIRLSHRPSNPA